MAIDCSGARETHQHEHRDKQKPELLWPVKLTWRACVLVYLCVSAALRCMLGIRAHTMRSICSLMRRKGSILMYVCSGEFRNGQNFLMHFSPPVLGDSTVWRGSARRQHSWFGTVEKYNKPISSPKSIAHSPPAKPHVAPTHPPLRAIGATLVCCYYSAQNSSCGGATCVHCCATKALPVMLSRAAANDRRFEPREAFTFICGRNRAFVLLTYLYLYTQKVFS
ncbi:unnamed protein product [Ceratitis capitata]|uniref:(Mediterranean fruit fly) hypothetical protein n=1 Tax=Ceratitis capitata TaxID=7213 RepID=A0A811U3A8_CERCA|nr:unnamed protein product [Ceratitis capitata]